MLFFGLTQMRGMLPPQIDKIRLVYSLTKQVSPTL